MADTRIKMIIGMPFLTLNNVAMAFAEGTYLEVVPRRQGLPNY